MKNSLKTLLLLIICGGLGYNIYIELLKRIPCREPILYAIGTFDTGFNISQEYFLSALADAEAIWEVSYGKDLFAYDPNYDEQDLLKVNLIYDYRQEATTELKSLGGVVEENQATYNAMESKYKATKVRYINDQSALNTRITAFNIKTQEYEEKVSYWNKQGGAPQKEYNELQAENKSLDAEMKAIQKEQVRLKDAIDEINALVVSLNKLADKLNITVRNYNTTNAGRGESFEEGLYVAEGGKNHIDIYEFSSRKKLVRVLAHELGHALGIEHVADPKSIMYEFNEGESMALSSDDLKAVRAVCGKK